MGHEKIVDEQKRPVFSRGMKRMVPALHLECKMEGRRSTRDQLQSFALVSIRTICPAPAVGTPKPMFETYSLPSGPKVIPVGKVRPVATVLSVPSPLTHTTVPVPTAWGPGKPVTVSVSKWSRLRSGKCGRGRDITRCLALDPSPVNSDRGDWGGVRVQVRRNNLALEGELR